MGPTYEPPRRNALMDFAQSASNAVASGVSGPVDLISMALRAAGAPIPRNALMSSEWMAERGLTRPVQQGAAQVLGETAGMLAPAMIAAKAPQVASAVNQGQDAAVALFQRARQNLLAEPTVNRGMGGGQRGAIDIQALKAQFPDVDFSLRQAEDRAFLDRIVVPPEARNQGRGSAFMEALAKAADEDAARLGLTPSSDFGGSKGRLEEFYRRYGFVPNKGKNRDFELMSAMVRPPKSQ